MDNIARQEQTVLDTVRTLESQIIEGEVNPLIAYKMLAKLSKTAQMVMNNPTVKECALNEYRAHGQKTVTVGDCEVKQVEAGTKYDYSQCGDSKLMELYAKQQLIGTQIKVREKMLKGLPISGMADPESDEILYPPTKSSKTTLELTFKK